MATNYYDMESTIHFGPSPTIYAGYYVSGSSDTCEFTAWPSTESRDEFEKSVKELLGCDDVSRIAPAAAMAFGASTDGERDWGFELLCKELEEEGFDSDRVEQLELAFSHSVERDDNDDEMADSIAQHERAIHDNPDL